ncbi:hypothetical protein BDF19DRAFT_433558 [Syncephalis fuscata]|nr:hypothetical protein BDF19DRAFT_433558 [Syncephalis fuscata]
MLEHYKPCQVCRCRVNPLCLNYIGQDAWLKQSALKQFKQAKQGDITNPCNRLREPGLPAGLENLGATCYMNALLQVLYHDHVFRQVNLLGLSTGEQQDAQEFCKLFLTMISNAFAWLPNQKNRELIHRRYIYGTRCRQCNRLSTRREPFFELELSIQKIGRLEECIQELLKSEKLTEDNQYFCENCKGKQDALRTLSIDALPQVLHLQLMRFAYDSKTFEKKKINTRICFPATLNMKNFVTSSSDEDILYNLTAVLLHDGVQANYGHFIAHILDAENQQCGTIKSIVHDIIKYTKTTTNKGKTNGLASHSNNDPVDEKRYLQKIRFTSKNAYMLIYTRRGTESITCKIPEWIANDLKQSEQSLDEEINKFESIESEMDSTFQALFKERYAIFNQWQITSTDSPYEKLQCSHGKLRLDYIKWPTTMCREEATRLLEEMRHKDQTAYVNGLMKQSKDQKPQGYIQNDDWYKSNGKKQNLSTDTLIDNKNDITSSNDYYNDIYCEHGMMTTNEETKILVSKPIIVFLQNIYPLLPVAWQQDAINDNCTICEKKQEEQKKDELDKNGLDLSSLDQRLLERMYDKNESILEDCRYYAISTENQHLLCQHHCFPFNIDDRSTIVNNTDAFILIPNDLWLQFRSCDNINTGQTVCNLSICHDCVQKRQMSYEDTMITIVYIKRRRTVTNTANPTAKSRHRSIRLHIYKTFTVLDIKLLVLTTLRIVKDEQALLHDAMISSMSVPERGFSGTALTKFN